MGKPFLDRSIRPEPAPFTLASLQGDWTCPQAAAERQAEFDRWSARFDAGHPLGPAHERQLLEKAGIKPDEIDQIMGDRK